MGRHRTGVLLTNLGTPDEATPAALRRYLAQFLWDRRVVDLPRLPWWLILHGIILRTRPSRVARAYRKVWTREGGPLLVISKAQRQAVAERLQAVRGEPVPVMLGMRYGNPSIASALQQLRQERVDRIIVLPLFPQYSAATTGSTFDAVSAELQQWRDIPDLTFIHDYHDHPGYIEALASSIREHLQQQPPQPSPLLLSFHGLPQRYHDLGDPFCNQCEATATLVRERLGLTTEELMVVYQSRFGREEWLQPYTDETLQQLASRGTERVTLACPGFSADCVETLEEIAIQNRELFLQAGGRDFNYIPALNQRPDHIDALTTLLQQRWGE